LGQFPTRRIEAFNRFPCRRLTGFRFAEELVPKDCSRCFALPGNRSVNPGTESMMTWKRRGVKGKIAFSEWFPQVFQGSFFKGLAGTRGEFSVHKSAARLPVMGGFG
jgi:hypothetical protein